MKILESALKRNIPLFKIQIYFALLIMINYEDKDCHNREKKETTRFN